MSANGQDIYLPHPLADAHFPTGLARQQPIPPHTPRLPWPRPPATPRSQRFTYTRPLPQPAPISPLNLKTGINSLIRFPRPSTPFSPIHSLHSPARTQLSWTQPSLVAPQRTIIPTRTGPPHDTSTALILRLASSSPTIASLLQLNQLDKRVAASLGLVKRQPVYSPTQHSNPTHVMDDMLNNISFCPRPNPADSRNNYTTPPSGPQTPHMPFPSPTSCPTSRQFHQQWPLSAGFTQNPTTSLQASTPVQPRLFVSTKCALSAAQPCSDVQSPVGEVSSAEFGQQSTITSPAAGRLQSTRFEVYHEQLNRGLLELPPLPQHPQSFHVRTQAHALQPDTYQEHQHPPHENPRTPHEHPQSPQKHLHTSNKHLYNAQTIESYPTAAVVSPTTPTNSPRSPPFCKIVLDCLPQPSQGSGGKVEKWLDQQCETSGRPGSNILGQKTEHTNYTHACEDGAANSSVIVSSVDGGRDEGRGWLDIVKGVQMKVCNLFSGTRRERQSGYTSATNARIKSQDDSGVDGIVELLQQDETDEKWSRAEKGLSAATELFSGLFRVL